MSMRNSIDELAKNVNLPNKSTKKEPCKKKQGSFFTALLE